MTATTPALSDAENDSDNRDQPLTKNTAATATPAKDEAPAPDESAEARVAGIAPYWIKRKEYLKRIRKIPELRQRFWTAVFVYLLRRLLWSFGFFPLFLAFWVPFVMANFNPVVLVNDFLPELQAFAGANPQVQANTLQTLLIAWGSIGFFFLIFDFVLTPFRSPYEYEADVYMRAWEQRHNHRGETAPTD
jgi:hypothetical protein